MPENVISVIYQVDARQAFQTADQVEKRFAQTDQKTSRLTSPVSGLSRDAVKALADQEQAAKALTLGFKKVETSASVAGEAVKNLGASGLGPLPKELGVVSQIVTLLPGAFLAVTTSVVALGAAVVLVSIKLKEQADAQLAAEERLTIEHNKQILALKSAIANYELRLQKAKETALAESALSTNISENDTKAVKALKEREDANARAALAEITRLEGVLRVNEKILENDRKRTGTVLSVVGVGESQLDINRRIQSREALIDRTKAALDKLKGDAAAAEDAVLGADKALDQIRQNQDATFRSIGENFFKRQEAEAKFAEEEAKRQAENVEKGKAKIKELTQTWSDAFSSLAQQAAADNPIARVFLQSGKALDDLKEKLKELPPAMREAALASQREFNATQLFGARVDNALGVFDLREMAAKFRDDTALRQQLAGQGIQALLLNISRTSNSTNPDIQRNINTRIRLANSLGDNPADKLDRQLDLLKKLTPGNSAEQAIIDQRILRAASAAPEGSLRSDQRELVAQIAERSAEREERRFQEAIIIQKNALKTAEESAGYLKKLAGINEKGGINAVESALTIKDETKNGIEVETRPKAPTSVDTSRVYSEYQGAF